jgi:hypothetical protein
VNLVIRKARVGVVGVEGPVGRVGESETVAAARVQVAPGARGRLVRGDAADERRVLPVRPVVLGARGDERVLGRARRLRGGVGAGREDEVVSEFGRRIEDALGS